MIAARSAGVSIPSAGSVRASSAGSASVSPAGSVPVSPAGSLSTSYTSCSGVTAGHTWSSTSNTGCDLPIRRCQGSPGESPRRASDCRMSSDTILARTRSRPSPYGGASRRTSSTTLRSASTDTRHR